MKILKISLAAVAHIALLTILIVSFTLSLSVTFLDFVGESVEISYLGKVCELGFSAKDGVLSYTSYKDESDGEYDWSWQRGAFSIDYFAGERTITCPSWFALVVVGFYPILVFFRGPFARIRRKRRGACVHCGYDLRASPTSKCSECGTLSSSGVDAERLILKLILGGSIAFLLSITLVAIELLHQPSDRSKFAEESEVHELEESTEGESPDLEQSDETGLLNQVDPCLLKKEKVEELIGTKMESNSPELQTLLARLKDGLDSESCDHAFPLLVEGECSGGQVLYLSLSSGFGGQTYYFSADTKRLIGIRTSTDLIDKQCGGKAYWPLDLNCRDWIVRKVHCGTRLKVGDSGNLPDIEDDE